MSEPKTPFTDDQVEFINELILTTIRDLIINIDIRDSNSWYTGTEGVRITVELNHQSPDVYETISSASDSFSFPSNKDSDY